MTSQAHRIIAKFGTQVSLASALGIGQSTIAAWKRRGFIPVRQQSAVLTAARRLGIDLKPADFFDDTASAAGVAA